MKNMSTIMNDFKEGHMYRALKYIGKPHNFDLFKVVTIFQQLPIVNSTEIPILQTIVKVILKLNVREQCR